MYCVRCITYGNFEGASAAISISHCYGKCGFADSHIEDAIIGTIDFHSNGRVVYC